MSTFNEKIEDLQLAICSILEQTYKDIELIVVLDNPDNHQLMDYLKQMSSIDYRIKLLINETNIGLARSLNKAFDYSQGEYIARMDADDISMPERFEKQLKYLKDHPEIQIVATDRINIDEDNNYLPTTHILVNDPDVFAKAIRYSNLITHPSIMMRRADFESLGGYRNFKAAQDYDLWLRAINLKFMFYTLPEKLLKYRIRANSISKSNEAKQHGYMLYARHLNANGISKEFSEIDYENFLRKKHMYSEQDKERYNKAYKVLFLSDSKNGRLNKIKKLVRATLIHRQVFLYYVTSVKKDNLISRFYFLE